MINSAENQLNAVLMNIENLKLVLNEQPCLNSDLA